MNAKSEKEIEDIKQKVKPILLKYGATHAGLFGSVVRGDMTKESDVDIYVEFPKDKHLGLKFITIILELKKALNREVDLVECAAGDPPIKKAILKQEIRLL